MPIAGPISVKSSSKAQGAFAPSRLVRSMQGCAFAPPASKNGDLMACSARPFGDPRRATPPHARTSPRLTPLALLVPFGDVDALQLEDYWACAIVAAADHLVLPLHPSPHNRSALQARVDVARNGIPRLGAVRAPWATGDGVGVGVGSRQRAEAALPEMVLVAVALEQELVAHVVAGARSRLLVRAVALLQLGEQLLVDYRHFHLVLHGGSAFLLNCEVVCLMQVEDASTHLQDRYITKVER